MQLSFSNKASHARVSKSAKQSIVVLVHTCEVSAVVNRCLIRVKNH